MTLLMGQGHFFGRDFIMELMDAQNATPDIGLIADHRGLDKIRQLGMGGDKKAKALALKACAEQFENMLTEQWYNAMRSSNSELNPDSPLHSKYSSMFEDMLAQQQVANLNQGSRGINKSSITYMVAKQFSKSLGDEGKELLQMLETGNYGSANDRETFTPGYGAKDMTPYKDPRISAADSLKNLRALYQLSGDELNASDMRACESQEEFVGKMMPYALKAVEGMGFNPLVVVAQAALETGWGKHIPAGNNLFGIKAGKSWQGESEALSSPECYNGQCVTEVSSFRKYGSVLDSMKDYLDFIKNNPRYAKAADKSFDPDAYFDEIQAAGYATDPQYAAKLKNISRQIAFMAYK